MMLDLTENVWVNTLIPSANHAALRSGFAGYPINPRWNAAKFKAWKTGRQWREALDRGEMVVRSTDSMLVPTAKQEEKLTDQGNRSPEKSSESHRFKFPFGAKQLLAAFHAV
ncbi:hypothetical protein [Coleofasciculus sp. LEGE 07092]|uniref:hypothetical protein n=2 Tax=unclassified Coleofasciculus TaxID=2692782 RepID=UPI00187FDC7C|nr:hypothetical protein [Coleofasciculus sp. LEGE 07092]MBE9147381.1 hypothetical protein [Coleofasciculus sp. LEGE 07092]